jgi:hypothetical protein
MSKSLAILSLSCHVSHLQRRMDLRLEFKRCKFVFMLICLEAQTIFNTTKAPVALPILAVTSLSVPPACRSLRPESTLYSVSTCCGGLHDPVNDQKEEEKRQ